MQSKGKVESGKVESKRHVRSALTAAGLIVFASALILAQSAEQDATARVIGLILGPSSIDENLRQLTDEIGGRYPGTEPNRKAVAWALDAFKRAGVDDVHVETVKIPASWQEGPTRLEVIAKSPFTARAVSIAWTPGIPGGSIEAPVLDLGEGTEEEFSRSGAAVRGSLILIHSKVLRTWADLFAEYGDAPPVIERSIKAGAAAILWTATREHGILYRHTNTFDGRIDRIPQVLVAREDALKLSRFIATGTKVRARLALANRVAGPIDADNVIGEIRGADKADEIVMIGAHLDSWELGTGALDNGCNAALVLEVARAVRAAGIRPRRTLRFALWNGEEQGMLGSWAYARSHRDELDRVVAYVNFDGGIGHVTGYSLGGRKDIEAGVRDLMKPVQAWDMNAHTVDATNGTDHLDFMLEGVPTLNANQDEGNYLPNYHATSDTLDKVDMRELKLHTAYAAVTMLGIANRAERLGRRLSRPEIEQTIRDTDFEPQMRLFGQWQGWTEGTRGRQK